MLDFISKYGIRHGIDYLVKIVPGLNCLTAQPHIVFSEVVHCGSANQDSNIQLNNDSFNFKEITKFQVLESKDVNFLNLEHHMNQIGISNNILETLAGYIGL